MSNQDTEQPAPSRPTESHPREDDRNEELPGSPAPDPEQEQGDAEDVPGAD